MQIWAILPGLKLIWSRKLRKIMPEMDSQVVI